MQQQDLLEQKQQLQREADIERNKFWRGMHQLPQLPSTTLQPELQSP
jgi:hypothetical protein